MKTDNIVVIRTFETEVDASIALGILKTYDVAGYLSNVHINSIYPIYNVATGGIKLHVLESDAGRALQILREQRLIEEIVPEETTEQDECCPHCGSENIRLGTATQKKYPWIVILISILFSIYPFAIRKAYHCFDCDRDFKTKK